MLCCRINTHPISTDNRIFGTFMDFLYLIDKLLFLKSNLKPEYELHIHITDSILITLWDKITKDEIKIEKTKLNHISCECTEIHNRVINKLKKYMDNVLPL